MVFPILFLLVITHSLSSGDTTIPSPATTLTSPDMDAYFQVSGTDLIVHAKLKSYCYFGLLYSNKMANVIVILI